MWKLLPKPRHGAPVSTTTNSQIVVWWSAQTVAAMKPLSQAAKSTERASDFSDTAAESAAHAGVPTQEGADDVDDGGPPVGVLGRRPGQNAKEAWVEEGDLEADHDMDEKDESNDEEDDFLATKNAIEQIMEIKVLQRKEVQGRFMKDLARNPKSRLNALSAEVRGGVTD